MVEKGYKPAEVRDDVDPRLDNRVGDQRPPLENDPAVPQQIDGPDLLHQEEHAEAVAKLREADKTERKGMFSPGDHGLSDLAARAGNDAGQADARLETDPGAKGSASTSATDAAPAVTATPGSASRTPAGVKDDDKTGAKK